MFFNVEILCMQKGGKFAKVWIAATRGTGSFAVKEILTIDLDQIGNEIAKYITSTSAQPRDRFSLVLSSKLICGLARLYGKKATIYLNDVFKFMCQIKSKPTLTALPSFLESPSEQHKRPKQKRPKKGPADSNTPDINVKITPDEEITDEALKAALLETQTPEELITLRDVEPVVRRPLEEEEMFGIGTIDDIRVAERTLHGTVEPSLIPQVPVPRTEEIKAEVHLIPRGKRPRSPEEKEPERRKRGRTAKVHEQVEIVEKVQPEFEPSVAVPEETAPKERADKVVEELPVTPEEAVLKERGDVVAEQPSVAPQRQKEVEKEPVASKRRIRKHPTNKEIIKTEAINTSALRRKTPDAALYTKGADDFHVFKSFCFTLTDVGNDYILESIGSVYADDENVKELLTEVALDSKSRDSLAASISSWRARLSGVPMKDVSTELTLRAVEVPSLSTPEVPPPLVQVQEEKMTAIEEEALNPTDTANGHDKALEGMTTIAEVTLPPAGYKNQEKEAVVDIEEAEAQKKEKGKPRGTLSEKPISSVTDVKEALQKWNWNDGFPTIEDVCQLPINRHNISVTFFALLELHKQSYVTLVENPETMELQHIEKGPEF